MANPFLPREFAENSWFRNSNKKMCSERSEA
jgi:hypothetical protein